jgi:hypothetical protein
METTVMERRSPAWRKQFHALVIADQIRQHASRIESHTDYQAVLIEGSKPSHILHQMNAHSPAVTSVRNVSAWRGRRGSRQPPKLEQGLLSKAPQSTARVSD